MANWGYTISKDNQIDFDNADIEIYSKLIVREPSVLSCMACGSCSSTCSAGTFGEGVNIRRLYILVSRGQIEGITAILNKCMLCGKCSIVCPRAINTRNFIRVLKDIISETNKN